jgi:LEA14-like dessication related protein
MKWLCRISLIVVMLVASSAVAEACKPLAERIAEGVKLVRVADVTHLSTSGMNLYLEVDNDTCYRLVVSDAEVDIIDKGEVLATISLRDKVVVKGKRTSTILVPLRFKSRSSFALLRILRRSLDKESGITLDYRIRGGIGVFRRTFEAEDVAVEQLLNNSELSTATLRELEGFLGR